MEINLKEKRGIIEKLPSSKEIRTFRLSMAFFSPVDKELKTLTEAIRFADPELLNLLESKDVKAEYMSSFAGDPDEDFEEYLESSVDDLNEKGFDYAGFLVINRSIPLGDNDTLPESQEDWDAKVPVLQMNEGVKKLFEHLRKYYVEFA